MLTFGRQGGRDKGVVGVADAIETFFATLAERGGAAISPELHGTLRFDLRRAGGLDQWYVTLARGQVQVIRKIKPADRPANCVILMEASAFERLTTGQESLIAMMLRNQVASEGELPLILAFRRFFPDAPGARDPRSLAVWSGE